VVFFVRYHLLGGGDLSFFNLAGTGMANSPLQMCRKHGLVDRGGLPPSASNDSYPYVHPRYVGLEGIQVDKILGLAPSLRDTV
jgi:hypothetical protein